MGLPGDRDPGAAAATLGVSPSPGLFTADAPPTSLVYTEFMNQDKQGSEAVTRQSSLPPFLFTDERKLRGVGREEGDVTLSGVCHKTFVAEPNLAALDFPFCCLATEFSRARRPALAPTPHPFFSPREAWAALIKGSTFWDNGQGH